MAISTLPSLLLLPPPPVPSTPASLKAAYSPSIKAALTASVSPKSSRPNILEIALPCPQLHGRLQLPRSQLFPEVSHLVAGLYSLACVICAEEAIEPEGPGGVDFRIVLVAYNVSESYPSTETLQYFRKTKCGPIIDLATLALTKRQWQTIFQVDGEEGLQVYSKYMELAARVSPAVKGERQLVTGGISMVSKPSDTKPAPEQVARTHAVVAVGGTFDHLHAGHKLLLTATALLLQPPVRYNDPPRRLIIGITGDELLKNKKYAEYLQSWKSRQDDVVDYLLTILAPTSLGQDNIDVRSFDEPIVNGKAIHTELKKEGIIIECVEIQDPFGPTITDETVSALAVSAETRSGGAAVNTKREEKGWKPLEVFEVEVLDAQADSPAPSGTESFDSKISSTAIRKREAERAQKASL